MSEYPPGFDVDLDWYSVDRDGHVGHFSSLGAAHVHPVGFHELRRVEYTLNLFFEALQVTTVYEATDNVELFRGRNYLTSRTGIDLRTGGWLPMVERGLFSYRPTSDRFPAPYVLVAKPRHPLLAQSLPREIRDALEIARLPQLRFATCATIDKKILFSE